MSTVEMQMPRVWSVPAYATSAGAEAVELCAYAGLHLDPWEEFVLVNALGERVDCRWAAFEVGLVVARQNGKGAVLEGRELAGLFLLDERFITHSAHQFDTSIEAFRRLEELATSRDEFTRRIRRVSRSHGEEGIELYGPKGRRVTGGQRIRFRTRTKGGGRGFTGDCLILDEAMDLPEAFHGALLPTLSARSVLGNPQVWYAASAVDQLIHDHGFVLSRIRERGLRGDDPSLAYFEWSVGAPEGVADWGPDKVDEELAMSQEAWAVANPSLGIRISADHIEKERRSMDSRTFAVERLGVGDWPQPDGLQTVIDIEDWRALVDTDSVVNDPVCFAFDVAPDRSTSSISVAGLRDDGLFHIEVIEHRKGTGWVVDRVKELLGNHQSVGVICDGAGPAGTMIHELEEAEVEVEAVTAKDHGRACGLFYDLVGEEKLRHMGTANMSSAIRGATKRDIGDVWLWNRKKSTVDISPLVSCTLALWGAHTLSEDSEGLAMMVEYA